VNKSLLDTDILSEIGKGIDRTVARHAAAYLSAFRAFPSSPADCAASMTKRWVSPGVDEGDISSLGPTGRRLDWLIGRGQH